MEEHYSGKRLITGTNCHFNYDNGEEHKRDEVSNGRPSPPPSERFVPRTEAVENGGPENKSAAKKKKKKKKKGTNADGAAAAPKISVDNVAYVDPEQDYPESRLIKVGPNGDLIVESLDDEYPRKAEHNPRRMVPPVPSVPGKLAHKILAFDDDQQRFWDSMSVEAQKHIFTIDADSITESMRQQQRELANRNISADNGHSHDHWAQNSKGYCTRCERNDLHIVNIIEGGFDTYMEELMEGLWEQFELQYHDLNPDTKFIDVASAEDVLQDKYLEAQHVQRFAEIKQIKTAGTNAGEMWSTVRNLELFYYIENILIPSVQSEFTQMNHESPLTTDERRAQVDTLSCVHQILRLIQSLNDRNRLLRETKGEGVEPLTRKEFQRMTIAHNLIDVLYKFLGDGIPGIPKAVEFVKLLANMGRSGDHQLPDVTEQMSRFADMFLNSDGKPFVDVLAKLKAGETEDPDEDDDPETEHYALKNPFSHCKCDFHNQLSKQFESARSQDNGKHDLDSFDEDDEVDYDEEYECDHSHNHDHEDDDDLDGELEDPETDEEEAEERRFKELRGFFFMEARSIIYNRFQDSYRKRVSEDRTKKFIEELEAEENAKKEKELKKLKQKEKQKEKKRLQQLEKEEKRKQKEAEEVEKANLLKKKQDELRAEQKRREEEIRLKKEKEKLKKIEALRQKELERAEKFAVETQSPPKEKKVTETKTQAKEKRTLESPTQEKKATEARSPVKEKKIEVQSRVKEKVSESPSVPEKKKKEKQTKAAQKKSQSSPSEQASLPPATKGPPVSAPVVSPKSKQDASTANYPKKDVPPESTSIDELKKPNQDFDANISFLPPKNHLLEQLYHARPKTVSATSGDSLDFLNEQGTASRMGTGYSPSKKSVSAYQADTWNPSSASPYPIESVVSPNLERPQFLNNVPGAANTWSVRNSQDAFHAPPMASPLMSSLPTSTMWNPNYPSRGNSIWGSSSLVNPEPPTTTLWGPQTPQNDLSKSAAASSSRELVQSAAFKAIRGVHSTKDASGGTSSALMIFQAAKTILSDPALKMSEFLSALHSSTKYHFEIIYDDLGSVTDINANLQPERIFGSSTVGNKSPSPQQTHAPPMFHSQPSFTQADHQLKFPGFVPTTIPMNQPLGQPSFQPGLSQDPFQPANGTFQSARPMNAHFPQNPGAPNPQIPGIENGFQGPFRGSSDSINQFDSKISETMQGSLNQLGIGQVRSGIW